MALVVRTPPEWSQYFRGKLSSKPIRYVVISFISIVLNWKNNVFWSRLIIVIVDQLCRQQWRSRMPWLFFFTFLWSVRNSSFFGACPKAIVTFLPLTALIKSWFSLHHTWRSTHQSVNCFLSWADDVADQRFACALNCLREFICESHEWLQSAGAQLAGLDPQLCTCTSSWFYDFCSRCAYGVRTLSMKRRTKTN